jgi:hypothetical protein
MKKEMFRRPTRMVHRLGELEDDQGPFSSGSFDGGIPRSLSKRRSPPLQIQTHGEHRFVEPLSPVVKGNAGVKAKLNGPAPDVPDMLAQAIPAGTKKRKA